MKALFLFFSFLGIQETLDDLASFPSSREMISQLGFEPPTSPFDSGISPLSTDSGEIISDHPMEASRSCPQGFSMHVASCHNLPNKHGKFLRSTTKEKEAKCCNNDDGGRDNGIALKLFT